MTKISRLPDPARNHFGALTFVCLLILCTAVLFLESAGAGGRASAADTKKYDSQNPHIELIRVPAGTLMFDIVRPANNRTGYETKHEPFPIAEFFIGKTEVTQAQWLAVMGKNPSNHKNCDDCPVEKVSWQDAQEFIAKLNSLNDGYRYRLPTIMEWEFAARPAPTPTVAAFLDTAWCHDNADRETHPVGQKLPNSLGIYDTRGNVQEWCQNWYQDPYGTMEKPPSRKMRSARGGGYFWEAKYMIANLGVIEYEPDYRGNSIGFRVAADPKPVDH
jgi:formylglycine-generating enzyme required for sulfatase activity